MPHGIYTETDIPPGKVDTVIALLKLEDPPPTSVQKIPQPDGNYTVIATWPGGTNVKKGGAAAKKQPKAGD